MSLERLKKITNIKENVKSAGLLVTQKLEERVDAINAQNTMIAATPTEQTIFTISAAAALLIDLKREKKQLKKTEQQALTERIFWGSLERESAKAGEQRTRETYIEKIQPIPPHTDRKFRYINSEDTEKAKKLMKQTSDTIKNHPNVNNIDSADQSFKIKTGPNATMFLRLVPSENKSLKYELTYFAKHDSADLKYIDQTIIWSDDGATIQAYEKLIDDEKRKTVVNMALSIEELTDLQQKILSHLDVIASEV